VCAAQADKAITKGIWTLHVGRSGSALAKVRTYRNTPAQSIILLGMFLIFSVTVYSHKHAVVAEVKHLFRSAKHALSARGIASNSAPNYSVSPFIQRSVNTVVVDMKASRTLPPGFFGINYSAFWDPLQGSAASANAFAQTPIKTLRFAGGAPADWYDWQDPYLSKWSNTSPLDLWHYAQKFGAIPLFQTNFQGHRPNPPGKSYAVNSPENAAAWVAYNRRSGIPATMEVGNEEDLHVQQVHDPSFQPYIVAFNAQARAMHQADPHVKVLGPAGTNEYQWWNRDSLGMFLQATGNRTGSGQVDGVSVHFYAGTTWYDARGVAQRWLSPDGPWAAIQQRIAANDTRHLPVYITEWNLGASDSNNAFNPTVGHALAVADMIGAFAQSGVAGEDYYQIHGVSGWGLLYGAHESRPADSPTPAYYAMALWGHMGNRLLPLQQSDDPSNVMSTYATARADGSIQVLAINKQSVSHTVRITLNGASAAGHHLHIYTVAPSTDGVLDSTATYNGVRMPSPQQPLPGPKDGGLVHGGSLEYTVPPYAAVVLDVDRTSTGPTLTTSQVATLLATAASHAAPFPPLIVTALGRVSNPTLRAGLPQTLSATIQSNYDIGDVLVDQEVYDSSGKKTFQQTQNVVLRAGQPITVSRSYALPAWALSGQYTYKIGIFGLNWNPTYVWNNAASGFVVQGASQPLVVTAQGRLSSTTLKAGQIETLEATILSNYDIGSILVDQEVYDSSGKKVFQRTQDLLARAGKPITVSQPYSIQSTAHPGVYAYKIGVFGPNWSPSYTWNNAAGSFTVETP